MPFVKETTSLCPTCCQEVPAYIMEVGGEIWMDKVCPEHGYIAARIEACSDYYWITQQGNPTCVYEGLVIDVTYRCNLACKWCYQNLSGEDVPVERIYELASTMPKGYTIILSGGEPTLRDDLHEIVYALLDMGYPSNVITNGYRIDWSLPCDWTLSYHAEAHDLFQERIAEAKLGLHQFSSIIFTDDNTEDFYRHIQEALMIGTDTCTVFRMHSAKPVGHDKDRIDEMMYVSDMLTCIDQGGHNIDVLPGYLPKSCYLPMVVDGVPFMLIAWPTIYNTDLTELDCAPWYYGKGNTKRNLVITIIKEQHGH